MTLVIYGSKKLKVNVRMETNEGNAPGSSGMGIGNVHALTIPLDAEDSKALDSAANDQQKEAIAHKIANRFVKEKLTQHHDEVLANRFTIWANEQAEFVTLHDHYKADPDFEPEP